MGTAARRWSAVLSTRAGAAVLAAVLTAPINAVLLRSAMVAGDPEPVDFNYFGHTGAAMLTGRFGDVLSDPAVQAGPFELLPNGIAYLLGIADATTWTVYLTAVTAALTVALVLVLLPRSPSRWNALLGVGLAALACLDTAIPGSVTAGHPADVAVPLLWVVAGRLAMQGRPAAAAAVVALSSGFEVWGVLGAPVLLLAPRVRPVRSIAAAAGVVAALYGPFALTGSFAMFGFHWPVADGSLVHVLAPEATSFPWALRILQGGLAVALGCVAALALRGRPAALWLTPVAVLAGRLLLDPVLADYYWYAPMVLLLGMLAASVAAMELVPAALAALGFAVCQLPTVPWGRAIALILLVGVAAMTVRALSRDGRVARFAGAPDRHLRALLTRSGDEPRKDAGLPRPGSAAAPTALLRVGTGGH
jgi:hypothetical protein